MMTVRIFSSALLLLENLFRPYPPADAKILTCIYLFFVR